MHLKTVTVHPEKFPDREHHPFNLRLLQSLGRLDVGAPVTFFVGENGTGKTTLLRAIAKRCGIFIWGDPECPDPREKKLVQALELEWADRPVPGSFFSSELFHNFSEIVEEWAEDDPGMLEYFGGKSLVSQSHGEALLGYFRSRYRIQGLYFLDEPETALSPRSQIELLNVLARMSREGHAQFLVATHSPILLACPGASLLSFDGGRVKPDTYENTQYFRVYSDFLRNPARYLDRP